MSRLIIRELICHFNELPSGDLSTLVVLMIWGEYEEQTAKAERPFYFLKNGDKRYIVRAIPFTTRALLLLNTPMYGFLPRDGHPQLLTDKKVRNASLIFKDPKRFYEIVYDVEHEAPAPLLSCVGTIILKSILCLQQKKPEDHALTLYLFQKSQRRLKYSKKVTEKDHTKTKVPNLTDINQSVLIKDKIFLKLIEQDLTEEIKMLYPSGQDHIQETEFNPEARGYVPDDPHSMLDEGVGVADALVKAANNEMFFFPTKEKPYF
jgi:hypothetical protein